MDVFALVVTVLESVAELLAVLVSVVVVETETELTWGDTVVEDGTV
jgi:hypothetical protein